MRYSNTNLILQLTVVVCFTNGFAVSLQAQTKSNLFAPAEWQRIDSSVDRALQWLASRQQRDGSFPTLMRAQPGVTSLCVMAFAAHGHLPGEGPYGTQLERALDFILSCQKPNGLIALVGPAGSEISRDIPHKIGSIAAYNHALSTLLLGEVFAMGSGDFEKNQEAIKRAVQLTLKMQRWPKRRKVDQGGWRYISDYQEDPYDSDLSITGWYLMSLRSAKNAGFEVPQEPIENAIAYVRRCFQPKFSSFTYEASSDKEPGSRGMAGAGILALAHAGLHDSKEARIAGDWLLQEGFANYNESRWYARRVDGTRDRYHYGVFCASQAMYQLGGKRWEQFFPPTARVILRNQNANGSWDPEGPGTGDRRYGNAYTTALMALTLGAPNQLLPIFQR